MGALGSLTPSTGISWWILQAPLTDLRSSGHWLISEVAQQLWLTNQFATSALVFFGINILREGPKRKFLQGRREIKILAGTVVNSNKDSELLTGREMLFLSKLNPGSWTISYKGNQMRNIKGSMRLLLIGPWTCVHASLSQPGWPHAENCGHHERHLLWVEHCWQMDFHPACCLILGVHCSLKHGTAVPHECDRK